MAESLNQRPVLFDLDLYSKRVNRANNLVTATLYSGFAAFVAIILAAGFNNRVSFNLIPLASTVVIVSMVGVALLWKAARKVTRLSNDGVNAAAETIHDVVLEKYDLDLVDPLVFQYRYESIAGKPFSAPRHLLRISQVPQKALDTVNNRTVEVILNLSEDNRDVTAFVLTQAPIR